MKKIYSLGALLALLSQLAYAQPSKPPAPPAGCNSTSCTTTTGAFPWDQCLPGNNSFVSDFRNRQLFSGTNNAVGSVYRYKNVGNVSGTQINATVTVDAIFQAVLNNVDDDASSDPTVNIEFFAPRIGTDVASLTTTDRRGYVQFTIRFFVEAAPVNATFNNNDFQTAVSLSNLNFIHYDVDGNQANTSGTAWFRETAVIQSTNPGDISVITAGITELRSYIYSDAGSSWNGVAGSVCERDNVSRCSQVAEYYRFNGAANQLTVRLGYDYQGAVGASGTTGPRQFGTRFNCVNLPNQGPLPLQLTGFNGTYKDGITSLNWFTEQEERFSHFELERSADAKTFGIIGQVMSKVASGKAANYQFSDDVKDVAGAVLYYRLRMVDADGKFVYSNVVAVRRTIKGGKLNLSPNPAATNAVIRYSSDLNGVADVAVSDLTGRIVFRKQVQILRGVNSVSLAEVAKLNEGVYQVQFHFNGEMIADRLVIQR